jgi:6-phosphogluconate dehydrogenase
MVHNGIEYGDMQLICEAYHLMKDTLGMSADEMAEVMNEWNRGELDSFLIEITRDILKFKADDGTPLLDKIRDAAGQVRLVHGPLAILKPQNSFCRKVLASGRQFRL